MHVFDAEQSLVQDLKDEGQVVLVREGEAFTITALRHPTLGKLVMVTGPDGAGAVVEVEE